MLITVTDYNNEINRVQTAMDKTSSPKQRRAFGKYLNRLKRELSGALSVHRGYSLRDCPICWQRRV